MNNLSVNDDSLNEGTYRELDIQNQPDASRNLFINVQDDVYGESGNYRLPLYKSESCPVDNKPSDKDIALIQCFPLLYATEKLEKTRVKKIRKGWIYIYVDGYLWRELECINNEGILRDVNLQHFAGDDVRPSSGAANHTFIVPHRLAGEETKVEIAFSYVQWSWKQITALGSVNPKDYRAKSNSKVYQCPDQEQAEKYRSARMVIIDGMSNYQSGFSADSGEHLSSCDDVEGDFSSSLYQDKNVAALFLPDYLGVAMEYATHYQLAWAELESYISDLSSAYKNPDKAENFPFSRWFDSAVLANKYFFSDVPEYEETKLSRETREQLQRAKDQREKWREHLSYRDIQTALGTEKRAELREKISQTKQPLTELLDVAQPSASLLQACLHDYLWLMPNDDEAQACCSDVYQIVTFIIDKLDWHSFKLDQHLETQPPKASELNQMMAEDKGVQIMAQIVSNQHQLSKVTMPQDDDEFEPPDNIAVAEGWLYGRPSSPDEMLAVTSSGYEITRRSSQAIAELIGKLKDAAIKAEQQGNSVLHTLITRSPIARLMKGKVELIDAKVGDFLNGSLPSEDYSVLRIEVERESQRLANQEKAIKSPEHSISDHIDEGQTRGQFNVFHPETKKLLYTDHVDGFRDGSAFKNSSRKAWKRHRHNNTFYNTTLKLWVYKTPSVTERLTLTLVEKNVFNKVVLPVVAVLEAMNLSNVTINAKSHWSQNRLEVAVNLSAAALDMAAVSAQINELLFKQRFAQAHGYQVYERLPRAVKDSAPKAPFIAARALGVGAAATSAVFAFNDMLINLTEGDDAAYAHLTYGVGFSLMAAAETAGLMVTLIPTLKGTSIAAFAGGPALLIGLAIVLAGAALLAFVFTEDTEMEQWLKFGPFSKEPENLLFTGGFSEKPYGLYSPRGRLILTASLKHSPGSYELSENDVAYTWWFKGDAFIRLNQHYKILDVYTDGDTLVKQGNKILSYNARTEQGEPYYLGCIGDYLRLLPFENTTNRFTGDKDAWQTDGEACFNALLSAIAKPSIDLQVIEINSQTNYRNNRPAEYIIYADIHLPYFIDDKSNLIVELTCNNRSVVKGSVQQFAVPGNGPKTIKLQQPLTDYQNGPAVIELKVRLDVMGDERTVLPISQDWLTESVTKQLGSYQYQQIEKLNNSFGSL